MDKLLFRCIKPTTLYLSCRLQRHRGDNLNRNINLFIVATDDDKDFVKDEVSSYKIDGEINLVIANTLEFMDIQETDKLQKKCIKDQSIWAFIRTINIILA